MILISFMDGTSMPDDTLELAVARNASDDAYFIFRDDTLICVPDTLVFKSVQVEDAKLPRLSEYLELHLQEVEDIDLALWDRFGFPVKH